MAAPDNRYGSVFEVGFEVLNGKGRVDFILFADDEGRLAGLDVHFCGNSSPVPDGVLLHSEPLGLRLSGTLLR